MQLTNRRPWLAVGGGEPVSGSSSTPKPVKLTRMRHAPAGIMAQFVHGAPPCTSHTRRMQPALYAALNSAYEATIWQLRNSEGGWELARDDRKRNGA